MQNSRPMSQTSYHGAERSTEYSHPLNLSDLCEKVIYAAKEAKNYDMAKRTFMQLHNLAQEKISHPKHPHQNYDIPHRDVLAVQRAFQCMVRYAPDANESSRIYVLLLEKYQPPIRADHVINRCLISLVHQYKTLKSKEDMEKGLNYVKAAVGRGIAVPQNQRPLSQRQRLYANEDPEEVVLRSVSRNILAYFQMQISEDGLRVEEYNYSPETLYDDNTKKGVAAWNSFSETQRGSNNNDMSSGNISGDGSMNSTEINSGEPAIVSSPYDNTDERQSQHNASEENQSNYQSGPSSPSNRSRSASIDSEPLPPKLTGRLAAASSPLNFALGFDSALCYPDGIDQVLLEVAHLKLGNTYENVKEKESIQEDEYSREGNNPPEEPAIDKNDHNGTNQTAATEKVITSSQKNYKEHEQPNIDDKTNQLVEDDDFQQRYLQGEDEDEEEEEEQEERNYEVNPDANLASSHPHVASHARGQGDYILFTPTTVVKDEKDKLTAEELANQMAEE